ncbi:MAG TPA: TusE/DsrC/DsvC family sulfur relay protein [Thermoanaerobaculia bacterium]
MSDDWTPESAEKLASEAGLALTEKHWRVIATCREFIAAKGRAPAIPEVSVWSGVPIAKINKLFPGGAERLLARFAGMTEPERRKAS